MASFPDRPVLARDEEMAIVQAAQHGDEHAALLLLRAHFPLLLKEARRCEGYGVGLDDLVADACVGLLEAIPRWRAERGCRFMTYASWSVRQALWECVRRQACVVRRPRPRGRPGLPAPHDAPLEAARELFEPRAPGPAPCEVAAMEASERSRLAAAVATLDPRQRLIVESRFGMAGRDERTLRELARALSVSKERVRQIEEQALTRLRLALG